MTKKKMRNRLNSVDPGKTGGLGKTIQTIAFLAGVYGKDSDAGTDTSVSDTDLHIFRSILAESNNIVKAIGGGGPEEEELIVQGVRFAFPVHQFAGGFDAETMRAFQELRDKARSCHISAKAKHINISLNLGGYGGSSDSKADILRLRSMEKEARVLLSMEKQSTSQLLGFWVSRRKL
ncbi:hypothetical protein Bca101_055127 [Brassica carinata]